MQSCNSGRLLVEFILLLLGLYFISARVMLAADRVIIRCGISCSGSCFFAPAVLAIMTCRLEILDIALVVVTDVFRDLAPIRKEKLTDGAFEPQLRMLGREVLCDTLLNWRRVVTQPTFVHGAFPTNEGRVHFKSCHITV